MRAVVQRVRVAGVTVGGAAVGSVGRGLVVLLGVARGDTAEDASWLASKVAALRIFEDEAGRMNLSVLETGGSVLLVSQFTLIADCRRGGRPSFAGAAPADEGRDLYERFAGLLRAEGLAVETGEFGAHMVVALENDGPVTLVLDSREGAAAAERMRSMSCGFLRDLVDEPPFVLASASPRRRRILEGLSLDFVVEPSGVPEEPLAGETPADHVVRLSGAKARAGARSRAAGTILGADTVVVIDGDVLGKPTDPSDAVRMLRRIRGRWHEVYTGLTLVRCSDGAAAVGCERTRVLVRDLADREVEDYVAGGEPLDKAGAYAIQECGAAVVERVEGCFYNVVGLPVVRLMALLTELKCQGR